MARFYKKSDAILALAIDRGLTTACYRALAAQLGFPDAREAFTTLIDRVSVFSTAAREQHFEALLWGASGLLPDPAPGTPDDASRKRLRALWDEWGPLRREAGTPLTFPRRCRPANTPERRLAYLAAFAKVFGPLRPLTAFEALLRSTHDDRRMASELIEKLRLDDPFWRHRTGFLARPSAQAWALAGRDRAIVLAANVILPALRAAARLAQDDLLSLRAERVFAALPAATWNTAAREAALSCFPTAPAAVWSGECVRQGLLEWFAAPGSGGPSAPAGQKSVPESPYPQ